MSPFSHSLRAQERLLLPRDVDAIRAWLLSPALLLSLAHSAFPDSDSRRVVQSLLEPVEPARLHYERELSLFLEPSSQEIQSVTERIEDVVAAMDANPTRVDKILDKFSSSSVWSTYENPEWLHGIDVVVEHGHSEIPGDLDGHKHLDPGRTDVWIVGWDGLILHSQNEGYSWDVQETGVKTHLQAVDFVDAEFGVAVGRGGTILTTEDGGASWERSLISNDVDYFAVDCIDLDRCLIVGSFSAVLETDDGATTWRIDWPAPFDGAAAIKMISEDVGLVAGREILKTYDGGKNWRKVFPARFRDVLLWRGSFTALSTADGKNFWAVGRDGTGVSIYRSVDGGESWTSQTENIDPDLVLKFDDPTQADAHRATSVFAQSPSRGYVGATNGLILATVDGGAHWWSQMATGSSLASVHGVAMRDARVGWAIGNLGHVFGTNSGGRSWVPLRGPENLFWTLVAQELGLLPEVPAPD